MKNFIKNRKCLVLYYKNRYILTALKGVSLHSYIKWVTVQTSLLAKFKSQKQQ